MPPPPPSHRTELKPRRFQCLARLLTAALPVAAILAFTAPDAVHAEKTITLSSTTTTISEGDSGKKDVVINVTLGESSSSTVHLQLSLVSASSSTVVDNLNSGATSCTSPSPSTADFCYVGSFSDNSGVALERTTTGQFTLGILGDEDHEEDETVTLRVSSIALFSPGWTAGTITLTIINDDEAPPTPTEKPVKPTGLTATALSRQVTLTWTDPEDAGIDKWQYQQKVGSADWGSWTDFPGSQASTKDHTFTGLTDGTEYKFRVRAVNVVGNSPQSEIVTITPELIKPVLTVDATQDGQTVLSWTVTDDTPAKLVTGATELVQWNWRFRMKGAAWPAREITPLTSDPLIRTYTHVYSERTPVVPHGAVVEYQVYVVGRNAIGTRLFGEWSDTATATVMHTAQPALTFTRSTVKVATDATATYTVALKHANAGTLSITSGAATKATVSPSVLTFTAGNYSTAQTVTVTGVETGSATIDHAFTLTGASAAAIPDAGQVSVTVGGKPDKPTGFMAAVGAAQVTLSWDDPSDPSITGWEYQQKAGGAWMNIEDSGATTTSHTVKNLTNGTKYKFRIRAKNKAGNGPPSAPQTATPKAKPKAPVLSAVAGDRSVTLSWTGPLGVSHWGYQYKTTGDWSATRFVNRSRQDQTQFRFVVPGLMNMTKYTFHMFARFTSTGQGSNWSNEVKATPMPMLKVPATLTVTEDAGNATIPVTVGNQIGAAVTLSVTYGGTATGANNPTAGDYDNDAVTSVTFSATDTTKNIVIPITDDGLDEDDETFTVTIALSSGTLPSGFSLGNATTTVTIQDNDTEEVVFSASELTVEEGGTGTYTVKLGALPSGSVTVTPASDTATVATVSGPLTFSTGNWSMEQTVTVTAEQDDDSADGTAEVSHAVTGYGSVTAGMVSVKVTDDEKLSVELRKEHEGSIHELHVQFGQSMIGVANDIIVSRTSGAVSGRQNSMLIAGRQILFGPTPVSAAPLPPAYTDKPLRLDGDVELTRQRVDSVLDLLSDSSFNVSSATGQSAVEGGMTLWGRGGKTSFKRNGAGRSIDGSVTVGGIGFEFSQADWMGGLAYFRTRGKGNVTTTKDGDSAKSEEKVTMNSVHPYVHWQASEEVELWGTLGYGTGRADSRLQLAADSIEHRKGRMELLSALLGTRVSWDFDLAFKGEVSASRTTSKGLSATPMKSNQRQYKAVVEWSRLQALSDGGQLLPKVEAGVRYDDDSYSTGLSMVLAGSVRYTDADGRWSVEAGGSVLRSRASKRYRENGVYVGVELRSGADGFGPSMSIKATQGELAEALQSAWAESAIDDSVSDREGSDGVGTQLEFGYGLAMGAGHMKPKVSVLLPAESGSRVYETGFEYRRADRLSLELTHTHKPAADRGDGIRLGGSLRW